MAGVRLILKNLIRRFRELGGELKLRTGVQSIHIEKGTATGVILDDGSQLESRNVLSSAGWVETMRLCDDIVRTSPEEAGRMSFTESVSILDCKPEDLGLKQTIVFYNDSNKFNWERCPGLCDARTGVICSPNNYLYEPQESEPRLPDGVVRITTIANHPQWCDEQ